MVAARRAMRGPSVRAATTSRASSASGSVGGRSASRAGAHSLPPWCSATPADVPALAVATSTDDARSFAVAARRYEWARPPCGQRPCAAEARRRRSSCGPPPVRLRPSSVRARAFHARHPRTRKRPARSDTAAGAAAAAEARVPQGCVRSKPPPQPCSQRCIAPTTPPAPSKSNGARTGAVAQAQPLCDRCSVDSPPPWRHLPYPRRLLRYVVQLLTPASIMARTAGHVVGVPDWSGVSRLESPDWSPDWRLLARLGFA